jgi:hypothetical protein
MTLPDLEGFPGMTILAWRPCWHCGQQTAPKIATVELTVKKALAMNKGIFTRLARPLVSDNLCLASITRSKHRHAFGLANNTEQRIPTKPTGITWGEISDSQVSPDPLT